VSSPPVVVPLWGELDISVVGEVESLLGAVEPGGDVVVDLTGVSFVDSVTLSVFVRASRRHDAAGAVLVLAGAQGAVRRVLAITNLDRMLAYADSVDQALDLVRQRHAGTHQP
jgi:anti-anti-sigma factor